MRLKLWWAAALLFCLMGGHALAQSTSTTQAPDARQLWQLLDYVAVDYGGAVEDGKITSESEYAEMQDFTANAIKQVGSLPEHADKARVAAVVQQLRSAVESKASGAEVARLAHQAADMLVAAYPIPVAPACRLYRRSVARRRHARPRRAIVEERRCTARPLYRHGGADHGHHGQPLAATAT